MLKLYLKKKGAEPIDYLAEVWRGTSLDQEEEIVNEFLLSLQLNNLSQISPFDGDLILHRDEEKMNLDEDTPTEFLVETKKYEADFQSSSDSTDVLENAILNEEDEIIDIFLLLLKLDHFLNDASSICSNHI